MMALELFALGRSDNLSPLGVGCEGHERMSRCVCCEVPERPASVYVYLPRQADYTALQCPAEVWAPNGAVLEQEQEEGGRVVKRVIAW